MAICGHKIGIVVVSFVVVVVMGIVMVLTVIAVPVALLLAGIVDVLIIVFSEGYRRYLSLCLTSSVS